MARYLQKNLVCFSGWNMECIYCNVKEESAEPTGLYRSQANRTHTKFDEWCRWCHSWYKCIVPLIINKNEINFIMILNKYNISFHNVFGWWQYLVILYLNAFLTALLIISVWISLYFTDLLVDMLCTLASYSITVRELKMLFSILQAAEGQWVSLSSITDNRVVFISSFWSWIHSFYFITPCISQNGCLVWK